MQLEQNNTNYDHPGENLNRHLLDRHIVYMVPGQPKLKIRTFFGITSTRNIGYSLKINMRNLINGVQSLNIVKKSDVYRVFLYGCDAHGQCSQE